MVRPILGGKEIAGEFGKKGYILEKNLKREEIGLYYNRNCKGIRVIMQSRKMRPPTYKRKRGWAVFVPPEVTPEYLAELARQSFYRGSSDHKAPGSSYDFSLTPPRPDASVCDNGITREIAEAHLREAIKRGNIAWTVPREKHPRYVFGVIDGRLHIGRLTVDGDKKAEYKGYPEQSGIVVQGLK